MLPPLTYPWLHTLAAAVLSVVVSVLMFVIGRAVMLRLARGRTVAHAVVRSCEAPSRLVLPLIALQATWHAAPDDLPMVGRVQHANGVLLIIACTWLVQRIVRGVANGIIASHPVEVEDNLTARRIQTQANVLARTLMVVVILAGVAMVLMTFPGARQIGASLLASAGVAGLVAGIAARPLLSNLIAGLQIALSQPLRLDDVLIVNGEWGRVESIAGTYVVLRIWDQRRLIIPLQWFVENPFENWTRTNAQLIGTVFLRVDYRMPLEPLRAEARRLCEACKDWDGQTCVLQVTDAGERSMELRILVSASNSSKAWDLRCFVREGLVQLMQRDYAPFLPQWRASLLQMRQEGPPDEALSGRASPMPAGAGA